MQQMISKEEVPSYEMHMHTHILEKILAQMKNIVPDNPIDPYVFFDEEMYAPAGSSSISMNFNIDRPVIINSMMISIPAGTTGLLTIGSRINIPITQNFLNPTGIAMIIDPTAKATLTLTGGTGIIMARFMGNSLRNDKWRRL